MIDRARILTTGANGMVGSYIDFGIRTDAKEMNILDFEKTMRVVLEAKPQAIIHLAAATDLDRAEQSPEYAYELNAAGTYNVAMAARAVGATLVLASTSGIFNGKKDGPYAADDAPDPQNYYARSKHMAELIVRGLLPDSIIVRGCWMFGGGPQKDARFVGAIVKQLVNPEIKALDDVVGSPTFAKDFVAGILQLLDSGKHGTFHLGNAGACTRLEVAEHIVATLKPSVRVSAVQGDYFKLPAARVTNESMISESFMRPWQEALTEYLETEWRPHLAA